MNQVLLYFSLKYNGDFQQIYDALQNKEPIDESLFKELKERIKCSYVTLLDEDYPKQLKQINNPPFVLYYYGDLSLTHHKSIGVIGMRKPNDYGKEVTQTIVKQLVNDDYTIVSGMAMGIDGIAHTSAINNNGKTIAILGTSIETPYPKSNTELYQTLKKSHLVLSEYPFNTIHMPNTFPQRNRIIAGLSDKLLVTQAHLHSGTMITVGYALDQGKDIYAVPGRIFDPNGTLHLIDQGAKCVCNYEDIIETNSF